MSGGSTKLSTWGSRQGLNSETNPNPSDAEQQQGGRAARAGGPPATSASSAARSSDSVSSSSGAGSTAARQPYMLRNHRPSISSTKSSEQASARSNAGTSGTAQARTDSGNGTESDRRPYMLRQHRAPRASSSVSVVQPPPEETTGTSLSKSHQDEEDLFGENYDRAAADSKWRKAPLTQNQLDSKNVQELESYAVERSEVVTQNIEDCRRVAEDTVGVAASTMENLHYQGKQMRQVHHAAANVEGDLVVGEKMLGKLGGLFSKKWKPKKGEKIRGPQTLPEDERRKIREADRSALLTSSSRPKPLGVSRDDAQARVNRYEGLTETQARLEMEREQQDDALDGLGDVVSQLKYMSKDIQEEAERQTASMGQMEHDLDTIHDRVKQAYNQTRIVAGR